MKAMLKFIFTIIVHTLGYTLINTQIQIPERPFYISTQIKPEHRLEIQNAFGEYRRYFDLIEITNKVIPHTRIRYGDVIGGTYLTATTTKNGAFELLDSIISFNRQLSGNTLQCVILHELLHSKGLYHSDVEGSVMNYTVKIKDGEILQSEPCKLHLDDIMGLINL